MTPAQHVLITPPTQTPWGKADHREQIAPGVWIVWSASHGGVWLSPDLRNHVPQEWQHRRFSDSPWYEEDCDWCIPFVFLHDHIAQHGNEQARRALEPARQQFERLEA